jgi:hypothetical protein
MKEHRICMRWLVIDMKDKGQTENKIAQTACEYVFTSSGTRKAE